MSEITVLDTDIIDHSVTISLDGEQYKCLQIPKDTTNTDNPYKDTDKYTYYKIKFNDNLLTMTDFTECEITKVNPIRSDDTPIENSINVNNNVIYKAFKSEISDPFIKKTTVGIPGYSNSCYYVSFLQCFSNILPLSYKLVSFSNYYNNYYFNKNIEDQTYFKGLIILLNQMYTKIADPISPISFIRTSCQTMNLNYSGEQDDPGQVFAGMVDIFDKYNIQNKSNLPIDIFNIKNTDSLYINNKDCPYFAEGNIINSYIKYNILDNLTRVIVQKKTLDRISCDRLSHIQIKSIKDNEAFNKPDNPMLHNMTDILKNINKKDHYYTNIINHLLNMIEEKSISDFDTFQSQIKILIKYYNNKATNYTNFKNVISNKSILQEIYELFKKLSVLKKSDVKSDAHQNDHNVLLYNIYIKFNIRKNTSKIITTQTINDMGGISNIIKIINKHISIEKKRLFWEILIPNLKKIYTITGDADSSHINITKKEGQYLTPHLQNEINIYINLCITNLNPESDKKNIEYKVFRSGYELHGYTYDDFDIKVPKSETFFIKKNPRILVVEISQIISTTGKKWIYMSDYNKITIGNDTYILFALILHSGPDTTRGHYTSIIRNYKLYDENNILIPNQSLNVKNWQDINNYTQTPLSELKKYNYKTKICIPYIYYYEKVDTKYKDTSHNSILDYKHKLDHNLFYRWNGKYDNVDY